MSGIQVPLLGWALMIMGILLLTIPLWPTIRKRLSDDELEIRITPNRWLENIIEDGKQVKNPSYNITPGENLGAHFGLVLINHNTNKVKHIESARLSLKKRTLLIHKVLFSVPVEYLSHPAKRILSNIILKPQETLDVAVSVFSRIPVVRPFPRKSKLVLVLKMIGYPRKIERELDQIKHDPKLVPDTPNLERQ